ncbi:MAG: RadC family protein [Anaerolineaceae bacterium]|jgi:DNA repair protein RadC
MRASKQSITVKELDLANRPRERLIAQGASALTDGELLAILLNSGTTQLNAIELGNKLLAELKGLNGLKRAEYSTLIGIEGVGTAKACRILAALELANRLQRNSGEDPFVVKTPEDVERLLGNELRGKNQEELHVIWLNTRNHVLGSERLYKGSQESSTVRVNEVFKQAVRYGASGVIIVHNHPSGDPAESPDDVNLTKSLVEAGQILDIRVLDHIIIAAKGIVSIRRNHPSLWT